MRRFTLSIVSAMAILLMGGVFVQVSAQSAAKKPFTFEDMMALKRIGGPAISPDGKWVLFSAVDVDLNENKRTIHLWVVPTAGGRRGNCPLLPRAKAADAGRRMARAISSLSGLEAARKSG